MKKIAMIKAVRSIYPQFRCILPLFFLVLGSFYTSVQGQVVNYDIPVGSFSGGSTFSCGPGDYGPLGGDYSFSYTSGNTNTPTSVTIDFNCVANTGTVQAQLNAGTPVTVAGQGFVACGAPISNTATFSPADYNPNGANTITIVGSGASFYVLAPNGSFTNAPASGGSPGLARVTVNYPSGCAAPASVTDPVSFDACETQDAAFSADNFSGTTPITYQWKQSTNGGSTWTSLSNGGSSPTIAGATSIALSLTGVPIGHNGNLYHLVGTNACGSDSTNDATLSVVTNQAPAVTLHPTDVTACSGDLTSFTVAASGPGVTYQWQHNPLSGPFVDIAGETNASLSLTALGHLHGRQYRCIVSGTCTPSATSTVATLSTNTPPVISESLTNSSSFCVANGSQTQSVDFTGLFPAATVIDSVVVSVTFSGNTAACNGSATSGFPEEVGMSIAGPNGLGTRVLVADVNNSIGLPGFTTATYQSITFPSWSNVTVEFSDQHADSIYDETDPTSGGFVPEQGLSAFNGGDPDGIWTLRLVEAFPNAHVEVNSWTVTVFYGGTTGCVCPDTLLSDPSAQVVCPEAAASFAVTVDGSPDSLRWQESVDNGSTWSDLSDGSPYAGTSSANLSVDPAAIGLNGNQYRILVYACGLLADSSSAALLTVQDTTPPTAQCQDLTIYLDANGDVAITANDADDGSSDNCGIDTITIDLTDFSCADVGSNSVTLTVTDNAGLMSTCVSTVMVMDTLAPVVTCRGDTTLNNDTDTCNAVFTYTAPTGSDNCPPTAAPKSVLDPGDIVFTAMKCDNPDEFVFVNMVPLAPGTEISFTDNGWFAAGGFRPGEGAIEWTTPALLPAGSEVIISNNNSANIGNVNVINVMSLASSGDQVIAYQDTLTSPRLIAGIHSDGATWNANAGSANQSAIPAGLVNFSTCIAIPEIDNMFYDCSVTTAATIPALRDSIYTVAKWTRLNTPTSYVTPNCGFTVPGPVLIPSQIAGLPSGSAFPVGTTTNSFALSDGSGNADTCSFTVTVIDNQDPVPVCQDVTIQLDAGGNATVAGADLDGGSTDNCGVASLTPSPASFTCNEIGSNTVTLVVADTTGNTDSCTANVTVQDTISPTAVCQDITVQLDGSGSATISFGDVDGGSDDNCALDALSVNPNSFTCANVGSNTVTLTVPDVNGNSSSCTATVTVMDTIAPTAVCQDITLQLDGTGNASITASDIDNGSSDVCGIDSVSVTPTAFTCADTGANTVTLTATDNNGNTATCTATVTVEDTIPPTAVCQDITLSLDGSGNASTTAGAIDNGSSDNCGISMTMLSTTAFTCADTGANSVTLTVTDDNGNTATCSATITVEDTIAPTAVCQDLTIQLDGSGNASITAADVDGGSTDNCTLGTLSISSMNFTCADTGANSITLTVPDVNGNSSTCIATVTIEDTIPPSAVCQDITVQLDGAGSASITTGMIDGGSTDNCSIASLMASQTSFTCSDTGANSVTLTVTDVNGNIATCTATVTIEDTIPPTAVCQDITLSLDGSGNASTTAGAIDNGSSDNCGISMTMLSTTAFTCADTGANSVTLTVTDDNGNTATCSATITVEDTIAPTAVCQDLTIQLDGSGNASITAADVDGGSTDNCTLGTLSISTMNFTCADTGANSITLTIPDVNGNSSTCTATVTIEDTIPPSAVCQDITVQLDGVGSASITTGMIDGGSTDNCSIVSLMASQTSFTCSDTGANSVTLTVTDVNGNIATCTATVTIEDTIPPTAVCQDITLTLDGSGNASTTAGAIDNGSSDNCGISMTMLSTTAFTCADTGANSVTLTVTDDNGNTATCSATITVEDTIAPTAVCQDLTIQLDGSGNASITAADVDGGSTDNCTLGTLSISTMNFTCADTGANSITLTVPDVNGNSSTCTATVTIEDTIPPSAVCQDITVQLDGAGSASITTGMIDGGSADNCSIASLMASQTSFTCSDTGANSVTLTVTDVNGNIATCTATVTIEDTIPPTAVCQDITLTLDGSGNASTTAGAIDNGSSDNCGISMTMLSTTAFTCVDTGTNAVTLTVTDDNGNTSTCSATVTVQDNQAPTAICQDITVQLDSNGTATITGTDVDGGSSDNCNLGTLTVSPNSFSCSDIGANSVTLTVPDVNGNSSSCNAFVTIEDNVPPTVLCQDITIQLDSSGNASITANDIDAGSSDACGLASVVASDTAFSCAEIGANSVTLTVNDVNGNVDSCIATVTVQDPIVPIAICRDITIQLDSVGLASITPDSIDNGSFDNCGIDSLSASITSFSCADTGANSVVLTVVPIDGATTTCTATVTVEDNMAPTAVCQNVTVFLDVTGNVVITGADVDGGSSDNCSIGSLVVSPDSFDCSTIGPNIAQLTVTDVNGNSASCFPLVTVEDTIPPTVLCQDITIQLDSAGNASISANDIDGGTNDACGLIGITATPLSFTCTEIGANTVTLTATDQQLNVDSCTATVTVQDPIVPIAICRDITIQLDSLGMASITPDSIDNGSFDNCGIDSLSASILAFTCADTGANAVTLIAVPIDGANDSCIATVTVEDNIAPTAVCMDITVQLDSSGSAAIVGADVDGGSTDNCSIASLVVALNSFSCVDTGANSVTLTVTDVNGNGSTCTATVTVEDTVPPVAICQDITVQLDSAGNASITAADIDNGSSDACGIATQTLDSTSFTCANVGSNPVVLTLTDVNGNVSTCNATVAVEDTIPPVALCQDITVQLDTIGSASITTADIDAGSTDNCGIDTLMLTPTSFTCVDTGANTVTLTVTDDNGNMSSCTATVTVEDTISPTAICQDITLQLDASGLGSITPAMVDNGSNDNCSLGTLSVAPTSFTCTEVGANTVTLTVPDVNGNSATCTATVTVEDTIAPVALCQDLTVFLDTAGNASITANDLDNGSNDACGIDTLILSVSSFTCAEVDSNDVTLIVTDNNGNVDSCTANVFVRDSIAPTAICQDITIQLDTTGNSAITAADIDGGSSDNCGIDTLMASVTAFTCVDTGANDITLTVTDNNGLTATCTATVTVEDTIAPTAICQDITIQLDANGDTTITAADVNNGSFDNCSLGTLSATPLTFNCSNVGGNTVTLTVPDVNGNSSTCTATVIVEDNVSPIAMCNNLTIHLDSAGNASITPLDVDNGSSDACGIDSLSLNISSFTCAEVGSNTVILTVTDNNGNFATCNSLITVIDSTSPTAVCQDITVQLDGVGAASIVAADIDNGSTDNCGVDSLTVTPVVFSCANVGANTVTLTVIDDNNNTSTCTATVTVEDTLAPTALCQDITIQLNAAGLATIIAGDVDNGSSDNCGLGTLSVSPDSFFCANVGPNVVTLTVPDVNGNTSTCVAFVEVEDVTPPVALCQDITVALDGSGNVTVPAADVDNGSADACGINSLVIAPASFDCSDLDTNTVVLTVTDVNGNASTCSALVTVEDTLAPTALCQADTLYLDSNGDATLLLQDIDGGSTDNCLITSATLSQSNFDCSVLGPISVQLTLGDQSGNTDSCTATVTVLDTIAPTPLCVDQVIFLDTAGMASTTAQLVGSGSTDNCSLDSLHLDVTDFTCSDPDTNQVTLTVFDPSGNSSTCLTKVIVLDTISPVISGCPADITLIADSSDCDPVVTWIDPTADDNCGVATFTNSHSSGDEFPVGVYTVVFEATDSSSNSATCEFTVTIQSTPVVVGLSSPTFACGYNVSCNGLSDGSVSAAVAGGCLPYSYLWSTGDTTSMISNLMAGTYLVTVTDDNGTAVTDSFVVTEPAVLTVDSLSSPAYIGGNNLTCFESMDGAIDLEVSGGADCGPYAYAWAGPNGYTATSEDLTTLAAGTYTITISDSNGCSVTDSLTLTEPDSVETDTLYALEYIGGENVSCNGATDGAITLTVSGGIPGYSFAWTGPNSYTSSDQSPTGLGAGTYVVTYQDTNGCSRVDSITLTEPAVLEDTLTFVDPACFGDSSGTVDLTVMGGTPGYAYSWSNGDTTQDLSGVPAGTYVVAVTDTNGCTLTDSVTLTDPPLLTIAAVATNESCANRGDGSIALTVMGGTPGFSYNWSTGDSTQNLDSLSSGTYSVIVTDTLGCIAMDTAILWPDTISGNYILASDSLVLCLGDTITLEVDSGWVSYDWSTGDTLRMIDVFDEANYSVLLMDSTGCMHTDTVFVDTVGFPDPNPIISPSGDQNLCDGDTLTLMGGSGYFAWEWNTGETSQNIDVTTGGTFWVTVYNGFFCQRVSAPITVTLLPAPTIPVVTEVNDTLFATLAASYQWYVNDTFLLGATNQFFVPVRPGDYTVETWDTNSCNALSDPLFDDGVGIEDGLGGVTTHLTLYPNPARDYLNIEGGFSEAVTPSIRILDMLGVEVLARSSHFPDYELKEQFEVSKLSAGVYFVELTAGSEKVLLKWVKQ